MEKTKLALKKGLKYGFVGVLAFSFGYEIYLNIGRTFTLLLLALGVVFVSFKLSRFEAKAYFLSVSVFWALSCVLGAALSFILTDFFLYFLSKIGDCVGGSFYDYFEYLFRYFGIMAICYAYGIVFYVFKAIKKKLSKNGKSMSDSIENAFSDLKDGGK